MMTSCAIDTERARKLEERMAALERSYVSQDAIEEVAERVDGLEWEQALAVRVLEERVAALERWRRGQVMLGVVTDDEEVEP